MLEKICRWAIEQYYRILISLSFITFLNFILLIITASDKLRTFLPLDTIYILLTIVPSTILATWFIGYTLDTKVKYMQQMSKTQTQRSLPTLEILERIKRIEEKLDRK
jgi:hypothetical protein